MQLRDVRIALQAQYWISGTTSFGDRDSHKGRVVSLQLEQDYFTSLEQLQVLVSPSSTFMSLPQVQVSVTLDAWDPAFDHSLPRAIALPQVWHRIDEQSPLWRMRDLLHVHLDGLEVSALPLTWPRCSR